MPATAETEPLAHQTSEEEVVVREEPVLPALERRSVEWSRVEFREQSDKMIFEGRAAVFGEWANIGGEFRERIMRGAFRKTDTSETVLALNHNYDLVMASSAVKDGPGMLRLDEGPTGLEVYAELPPTQTARDTQILVKTGVIRQMSFAWPRGAAVDTWNDGYDERSISEFKTLTDVSPVVFPAYKGTQASARSLYDALNENLAGLAGEERIAAYEAFLKSITPDTGPNAELFRRAIGQAASDTAAAAEADQDGNARGMGHVLTLAALNTRLRDRNFNKRGVTT